MTWLRRFRARRALVRMIEGMSLEQQKDFWHAVDLVSEQQRYLRLAGPNE